MIGPLVLSLVFRPDDVIGEVDQCAPNRVHQTGRGIVTQQNVDGVGVLDANRRG